MTRAKGPRHTLTLRIIRLEVRRVGDVWLRKMEKGIGKRERAGYECAYTPGTRTCSCLSSTQW